MFPIEEHIYKFQCHQVNGIDHDQSRQSADAVKQGLADIPGIAVASQSGDVIDHHRNDRDGLKHIGGKPGFKAFLYIRDPDLFSSCLLFYLYHF